MKQNSILIGLIFLTIIWLGALLFLMSNAKSCAGEGFWQIWFSCRSINELGDFLAGAFAPLAFIWLAGAVVLQSSELRAQRAELQMTREIYQQEIELIKAQTEDMKQNAKFIGLQAEAAERTLQLEIERDEQKKANRLFDNFADYIRSRFPVGGGELRLGMGLLPIWTNLQSSNPENCIHDFFKGLGIIAKEANYTITTEVLVPQKILETKNYIKEIQNSGNRSIYFSDHMEHDLIQANKDLERIDSNLRK